MYLWMKSWNPVETRTIHYTWQKEELNLWSGVPILRVFVFFFEFTFEYFPHFMIHVGQKLVIMTVINWLIRSLRICRLNAAAHMEKPDCCCRSISKIPFYMPDVLGRWKIPLVKFINARVFSPFSTGQSSYVVHTRDMHSNLLFVESILWEFAAGNEKIIDYPRSPLSICITERSPPSRAYHLAVSRRAGLYHESLTITICFLRDPQPD